MGHEDSIIATWLQSEGYQTALIGKYLNGYARRDDDTYVPPGWDEWYVKLGGDSYYDYRLNDNGTVVHHGNDEQDYETDVLAGKAKDYVRYAASDSSPFFMYLAPRPHTARSYRPRITRTLTRTSRRRDRPRSTSPMSTTSLRGCAICPA
jgi:N-acetylglucosamine-6-sulfatase